MSSILCEQTFIINYFHFLRLPRRTFLFPFFWQLAFNYWNLTLSVAFKLSNSTSSNSSWWLHFLEQTLITLIFSRALFLEELWSNYTNCFRWNLITTSILVSTPYVFMVHYDIFDFFQLQSKACYNNNMIVRFNLLCTIVHSFVNV